MNDLAVSWRMIRKTPNTKTYSSDNTFLNSSCADGTAILRVSSTCKLWLIPTFVPYLDGQELFRDDISPFAKDLANLDPFSGCKVPEVVDPSISINPNLTNEIFPRASSFGSGPKNIPGYVGACTTVPRVESFQTPYEKNSSVHCHYRRISRYSVAWKRQFSASRET